MNRENQNQLICEACGSQFACGAKEEKCWCFEIPVAPEVLPELQKEFNNCLCRGCLKKRMIAAEKFETNFSRNS